MSMLSASSYSTSISASASSLISSVPPLSEEQKKTGILAITNGRKIIQKVFDEADIDRELIDIYVETVSTQLNGTKAEIQKEESTLSSLENDDKRLASIEPKVVTGQAKLSRWRTETADKPLFDGDYFNLDNLKFLGKKFEKIIKMQPNIQRYEKEIEELRQKNIPQAIERQNATIVRLKDQETEEQTRLTAEQHKLHVMQAQAAIAKKTIDAADVGLAALKHYPSVAPIPHLQSRQIIRFLTGENDKAQIFLADLPNQVEAWKKKCENIDITGCEQYVELQKVYINAKRTCQTLQNEIANLNGLLNSKKEAVNAQQAVVTEKETFFKKWDEMKKAFNWTDEDMAGDRHYKDSKIQIENALKELVARKNEENSLNSEMNSLLNGIIEQQKILHQSREAIKKLEARNLTQEIARKIIGEKTAFDEKKRQTEKTIADLEACKVAIIAVSAPAPRTISPPLSSPNASVRRRVSFVNTDRNTIFNFVLGERLIETANSGDDSSSDEREFSPDRGAAGSTKALIKEHSDKIKKRRADGELKLYGDTPPLSPKLARRSIKPNSSSSSRSSTKYGAHETEPGPKRIRTKDRENPTVVSEKNGHAANGATHVSNGHRNRMATPQKQPKGIIKKSTVRDTVVIE